MENKVLVKPSGIKCWNCGAMMNETGRWFTCPKCGATDTLLPTLGRGKGPTPGQGETKAVFKGKQSKLPGLK